MAAQQGQQARPRQQRWRGRRPRTHKGELGTVVPNIPTIAPPDQRDSASPDVLREVCACMCMKGTTRELVTLTNPCLTSFSTASSRYGHEPGEDDRIDDPRTDDPTATGLRVAGRKDMPTEACPRPQPCMRVTQAAQDQTDRHNVRDTSYTYGPEPQPCCETRTARTDDPTAGSRTAGRMDAPTVACTRPRPRLRLTQAAQAPKDRLSVWDASYKYGPELRPCCEARRTRMGDPTCAWSRTAGRMDTPTAACTRPQPHLRVTQTAQVQIDRQGDWDASYKYGSELRRPCWEAWTACTDDPTAAGLRAAGPMDMPTAACSGPQPCLRVTKAAQAQTDRHNVRDAPNTYGPKPRRPCCEARTGQATMPATATVTKVHAACAPFAPVWVFQQQAEPPPPLGQHLPPMGRGLLYDPPSQRRTPYPPNKQRIHPSQTRVVRGHTTDADIEKNPGPVNTRATENETRPHHREMVTRLAR